MAIIAASFERLFRDCVRVRVPVVSGAMNKCCLYAHGHGTVGVLCGGEEFSLFRFRTWAHACASEKYLGALFVVECSAALGYAR